MPAARITPTGADAFFRTEASARISYTTGYTAFRVPRRRLGWDATGRTRPPDPDFRQMVVRRVQAWHAKGVDVDARIAAMATYLGHIEVRDVYCHFTAIPEMRGIVSERFQALNEGEVWA